MSRRIGVVTVGRSDYGIYFPVLRLLNRDNDFDLKLIVAGAHLSPTFGNTVQEIENDGFPIASRIAVQMPGDSRQDVAVATGQSVEQFAEALANLRPDILLVLGDRYEMFAAGVAALPLRIPVAHIHGGELTQGAIDDAMRHCLTKLSHLHFAATEEYGKRIRQLGEESWRVHVTGSPAIDSILSAEAIPRADLETELGLNLSRTLLITYHPVTLQSDQSGQISALLTALSDSDHDLLFTYPNADSDNSEILTRVKEFIGTRKRARLVSNLGHRRYHSVQEYVAAMVGNSSSGIIEAASFHLPVVNVGIRQMGRVRAANVIDVEPSSDAIRNGIARAVSRDFRSSLASLVNPYGDGHAAERIVAALKSVELEESLIIKRFVDVPF